MKIPNFFIVGAGKAGTTSLYEYLQGHPDIFLPKEKEPHYFAAIDGSRYFSKYYNDTEAYLGLFRDVRNEVCVGEASVGYLFSQSAPAKIYAFNPAARIIIMVRNPVELIYSIYHQRRFMNDEKHPSFSDLIEEELQAYAEGRDLFYLSSVPFADSIRRYLDIFPRDQVHIIQFDRFRKETLDVYRETLAFLEVSTDFVPDLSIKNASRVLRSPRLSKIFTRLRISPAEIRDSKFLDVARKLIPVPLMRALIESGKFLYTKSEKPVPMPLVTRKQIAKFFEPEFQQLETLIGWDLKDWRDTDREELSELRDSN